MATAATRPEREDSAAAETTATVVDVVTVASSPAAQPAYVAPGGAFSINALPDGFVPLDQPITVAQEISPAGYSLVSQAFNNANRGQLLIVSVTSEMPAGQQLREATSEPVVDGVLSDRTVYAVSDSMTGQRGMAWAAGPTDVVWLYGTSMSDEQLALVARAITLGT